MKCEILHETRGRIRIHMNQKHMTLSQADMLEYYLRTLDGVLDVTVHDRTCNAIVFYDGRCDIPKALLSFSYGDERIQKKVENNTTREMNRDYEDRLFFMVTRRLIHKFLLPAPIQTALTVYRSVGCIGRGLRSLAKRSVDVSVLDAAAVVVALAQGDVDTAASVMFMVRVSETLAEWTRRRSMRDLARLLSLNTGRVWVRVDGQDILLPVDDVKAGDSIVVRTGNRIPLDGNIISGEAIVNQRSITGEWEPVRKEAGSYAYAGTVVERGECVIRVDKDPGYGTFDRILTIIREEEHFRSPAAGRASKLSNHLVPYSLFGGLLTYLLTGNPARALAVLTVDFSGMLEFALPLASLSAMRESSSYHIDVKGGSFLEDVSEAKTMIFDKTGTLTHATPKVVQVVPMMGWEETEILRLAACLEEHYPHPMADAVVAEAHRRGLSHEEYHTRVEFVVAHGIASTVEEKELLIGSHHFIFQDGECVAPEEERERIKDLEERYSCLYLAVSGELAGVICLDDPVREEAAPVITSLHKLGIERILMLTGDNERTAKTIADLVGMDEYYAGLLPEEKAEIVRKEQEGGKKVIMIGDSINDAPALAQADVGIAISDGATIAREIADITISSDDLFALVTMKSLSDALMARIRKNYRSTIVINSILILLGGTGILSPTMTATLHNLSTLGISLENTGNLLD